MLSNSLLGFHSLGPATAVRWTESDAKIATNPSPQLSDTKIKNNHTWEGWCGGKQNEKRRRGEIMHIKDGFCFVLQKQQPE